LSLWSDREKIVEIMQQIGPQGTKGGESKSRM